VGGLDVVDLDVDLALVLCLIEILECEGFSCIIIAMLIPINAMIKGKVRICSFGCNSSNWKIINQF